MTPEYEIKTREFATGIDIILRIHGATAFESLLKLTRETFPEDNATDTDNSWR